MEAWPQIEPAPLIWNWHLEALCDHLQAVSESKIQNLLANVPPGTSKSLITAVMWQPWEWTREPHLRSLYASYDAELSMRDSVKCRTLINSKWYQDRWGHKFKITDDQDQKRKFANDKGGYRMATSITGHGTGEHPHRIVVDDPQDRRRADSEQERQNVKSWWNLTMSTRGVSLKARRVVIMQRLHAEDLSGIILEDPEGWDHLLLPMRYEPQSAKPTALGMPDRRTKAGELLSPRQFPEEVVRRMEKALGSYGAAGQLQQRPSPEEGGIIKRAWWRFYDDLPLPFDKVLWSWDATFKEAATSDFVVGQVWGLKGIDLYLIDQWRDRADFVKTVAAVRSLRKTWRTMKGLLADEQAVCRTLIEDTANGPAIISTLRHEISGLIGVRVKGSKQARLQAIVPLIEAGQVYLPNGKSFSQELIEEAAQFPNGAHDDQLDAMSQALVHLQPGTWNPAEKQEPKPKSLLELREKQLRDAMAEALKPKDDEAIPSRYGYING